MGMCKGCDKVFSALEMKDGYCKDCLPIEIEKKQTDQKTEKIISTRKSNDIEEVEYESESGIGIYIVKILHMF